MMGPPTKWARCLGAVALLTAAGCGGVDTNVEKSLTIQQGVYGQLIGGCDTAGCSERALTGKSVALFRSHPSPLDGGAAPPPVVSSTSGTQGFYELAAGPGSYFLAAGDPLADGGIQTSSTAIEVTVPAGAVVRWDFTSGSGGGNWTQRGR